MARKVKQQNKVNQQKLERLTENERATLLAAIEYASTMTFHKKFAGDMNNLVAKLHGKSLWVGSDE